MNIEPRWLGGYMLHSIPQWSTKTHALSSTYAFLGQYQKKKENVHTVRLHLAISLCRAPRCFKGIILSIVIWGNNSLVLTAHLCMLDSPAENKGKPSLEMCRASDRNKSAYLAERKTADETFKCLRTMQVKVLLHTIYIFMSFWVVMEQKTSIHSACWSYLRGETRLKLSHQPYELCLCYVYVPCYFLTRTIAVSLRFGPFLESGGFNFSDSRIYANFYLPLMCVRLIWLSMPWHLAVRSFW